MKRNVFGSVIAILLLVGPVWADSSWVKDDVDHIILQAGSTVTIASETNSDINLVVDVADATKGWEIDGTLGAFLPKADSTVDIGTASLEVEDIFVETLTASVAIVSTGAVTAGGDVNFATGKTVAIQEATAGSACSGTLTANGATPVVTSTSCATTGSRIFLTRTSAETGSVSAWRSALSTGVSFSVTSEAADTGTYDWLIVHEAP